MITQSITDQLAEELGSILLKRKIRCAVAESCTGGGLAAAITNIPGSSQWFDRGFITYSNEAKEQMLAVPHGIIAKFGAVSEETARAMAHGVIEASDALISVSITGIAGPNGGSKEKPVGTVWISWAGDLQPTVSQCYLFSGDRSTIRQQAVKEALKGLIQRCDPKQLQQKSSERYFFALFPNEEMAQALVKRGQQVIDMSSCVPTVKENIHMTLVYLGQVPPRFLQQASDIASQIHSTSFELNITKADSWSHHQIGWLGLEETPEELDTLVKQLNGELIAAGFKPERRAFTPHITIARKYSLKNAPQTIKPLTWQVTEFCLVKSTSTTNASKYEVIKRWPLSSKS